MSRPTLFGRPLTNAEKQERWRQAHPCFCRSSRPKGLVRTSGLLDLLVRTDTSNVVRYLGGSRGSGGCIIAPRCDVCGLLIRFCRCIAGTDY